MKLFIRGRGSVRLSQADFVARGGQATIYAKGGQAFKLYSDPKKMIPRGKMQQLARIADSRVVKPERVLSDTAHGPAIGYTMRYIRGGYTLCQLFPRCFRQRHNITPDKVLALVKQMRELVANVHAAGALVVDLNEMNFLVSPAFDAIYAIDVDSYQTAHYPADAIMPSVRDPQTSDGQFNELSDWFSFAVVTFQMFIGIHPYKGKHSRVKTLAERMKRNLSVFDPAVKIPKVCYPYDVIPDHLLAWYRSLLEHGRRLAPPKQLGVVVKAPVRTSAINVGKALDITELASYADPVRAVFDRDGSLLVLTDREVWQAGRPITTGQALPGGTISVGFSGPLNRPVLASNDQQQLRLYDLLNRTKLQTTMAAEQICSSSGHIYLRNGDQILRVVLTDVGPAVIASYEIVANVLPHATRLYPGVAIQDLLGATYVSLLTANRGGQQLRLVELDGQPVLDAKYEKQVLMVIVATKAGAAGATSYDRYVFRFSADFAHYDLRRTRDVSHNGLNFVTLDSGICVCLTPTDELEVFANRPDSSASKLISDEALCGDMLLARNGDRVLFFRHRKVYQMTLRSARNAQRSASAV